MSKNFKMSVIMPVYNAGRYLQETIDCVLRQTIGFEEAIQLIFVDDGSTDNSPEICKACAAAHPENVTYIRQENAGVSAARNAGIPHIEAPYVTFFDSDDIWDDHAFEKAYRFLEKHADEIDLVACRSSFFEGKTGYHNLDAKFRKGDRVIDVSETPQYFVMGVTTTFLKSDVAKEYRFDERLYYGEDAKFLIFITLRKGKFGVLKSAEYHIRERNEGNSLTQTYRVDRYTTTMEHYYCWMREAADGEFSQYRPYLEQCLLNGLKYRITQEPHAELENPEAYRDTVYDLIKRSADVEFTRTPSVGCPRKLHLMYIKHGEEALSAMEIRNGRVYSRGYDMGSLTKNTLEIKAISCDKKHCVIEGVYRALPDARIKMVAVANGVEYEPALAPDEATMLLSLKGEPVVVGKSFAFDIPLSDKHLDVQFAVRLADGNNFIAPAEGEGFEFRNAVKGWDVELDDNVLRMEKRSLFGGSKGHAHGKAAAGTAVEMSLDQAAQRAAQDLGCSLAEAKERLSAIKKDFGMDFEKQVDKKAYLVPDSRMKVFKNSVVAEIVADDNGITAGEAFVKLDALRNRFGLSHTRIATKNLLQCASEEELVAAVEDIRSREQRYINRICEATGQSAEEVMRRSDYIREEYSVSLQQYCNYGLYLLQEEEIAKWAEDERAARNATIARLAEETGWSKRRVRKHMSSCSIRYNVDSTHYLSYRCWQLSNADLEGFATQTVSSLLSDQYNTGDVAVLDSKVLFNEAFADLMGRKAWVNRDTSFEEFQEFAQGLTAVFCKPESLSFGVGAERVEVGEDLHALYEDLMSREKLIVEEYVQQHHELAEFAASCANTLRFVNICKDGVYSELGCFIRLGRGDAAVDNYGAGGIAAAVDLETGVVVTPGVDKFGGCHEVHPVSGKAIVGFQIPHWEAVRDLAKRALEQVDGIDYVGWDIAVREDGPVLIEGNSHSDIRTYQACWAREKRGTMYLYKPFVRS